MEGTHFHLTANHLPLWLWGTGLLLLVRGRRQDYPFISKLLGAACFFALLTYLRRWFSAAQIWGLTANGEAISLHQELGLLSTLLTSSAAALAVVSLPRGRRAGLWIGRALCLLACAILAYTPVRGLSHLAW